MKKVILFIVTACIFLTTTIGAFTHLCPGCINESDTACSIEQPSTEKETCHSAAPVEKETCCKNTASNSDSDDCKECDELENPSVSKIQSQTNLKLKLQLDHIDFAPYFTSEKKQLSPKSQFQINMRASPPSLSVVFLRSVRLLC
ncbi:hypothetical protein DID80_08425 [Candidatus Marinamargulisbacteria bacterium SCGC AAA071-K20]|nr:hypothetical protein DID80_08425 [Candidatus Marinamargulisbacteria bacterium SCGC AAA071-K20]